MTDRSITDLEFAALEFAKVYHQPHGSIQEHQQKLAVASAMLITAALEITDNGTADK